jgi:SET domain-containing protein
MTDSVPKSCWLSPKLQPRRSPIEGLGLFAVQPIGAGEVVIRLGGRVIDEATLLAQPQPYSSVAIGEDRHLLIDPDHPATKGNHSCDPNLWHEDAVTISARRPIAPGEEAVIDYVLHTGVDGWSMTCACGSPLCRRELSGTDWRRPELQRAYAGHFSPPIQTKISRPGP